MPALVYLEFNEIAVYFIRRILFHMFFGVYQWTFSQFSFFFLPEFLKISRHSSVWTQLFRREAYFYMMRISLTVYCGCQATVTEARFFHGTYGDYCFPFL